MDFYIIIKKRIAEVLSSGGRLPLLVCGNRDNRIIFTFDSEWAHDAVKTARFVYRENKGKGGLVYCDVPFKGNVVSIPVFENVSELWVGVTSSGGVTTSAARFACVSSIGGFSAEESGNSGSGVNTTEEVEVSLMLSDGDQIVKTASGNPMSTVTIKKPDTLVPANIRSGVTIAGVTGTYAPSDTSEPAVAPVISLDGDTLRIEHDFDTTRSLFVYANDIASWEIAPSEDGVRLFDIKEFLRGRDAGVFTVTVEAYGYDLSTVKSNAVTYVYDGSLEAPGDHLLGFGVVGSDSIEVSYVLGRSDLSELVDGFDGVESVTTTIPGLTFTDLHEDSYVLFYLPERVTVKDYARCEVQTYDDPRFVQIYNFTDDGIAVCNFEYTEPIGETTLSLDGTTLVIEQSGGIPSKYHLIWAKSLPEDDFYHKEYVTPTGSTTRVDISSYLKVGNNYFKVKVYDEEGNFLFFSEPVSYMLLSGLSAPTISLDGTVLKIRPGEGVATSYEIRSSEDGVTYSTATTVEANGEEAVTVDITEYAVYATTYFKVRAVNTDTGESAETADSVTYVAEAPDPLTAPTISLDGTVLTITPGEGVATSYEILSSEDGVTYSTAATVDANGEEAVTVDIEEYAVYEETYFKVRAVNADRGESAESATSVTYSSVYNGPYTLKVICDGTVGYYYAVNMEIEEFGGGKYDGLIRNEGVIENLVYGDVVYIRPFQYNMETTVLDVDDSFTYTLEYNNYLVVATNFKGDGSITLSSAAL